MAIDFRCPPMDVLHTPTLHDGISYIRQYTVGSGLRLGCPDKIAFQVGFDRRDRSTRRQPDGQKKHKNYSTSVLEDKGGLQGSHFRTATVFADTSSAMRQLKEHIEP